MPDAEPTDLSAVGASSNWLDARQVPGLRAELRRLSTRIAQNHLSHARVPNPPSVVTEG